MDGFVLVPGFQIRLRRTAYHREIWTKSQVRDWPFGPEIADSVRSEGSGVWDRAERRTLRMSVRLNFAAS